MTAPAIFPSEGRFSFAALYPTQAGKLVHALADHPLMRLDALATLAEAYEAKHYSISPLTGRQMAAIRKATGSTSCGKVVSKDRNFNAIFGVIRPYLFASIVDLAPKTPDRA